MMLRTRGLFVCRTPVAAFVAFEFVVAGFVGLVSGNWKYRYSVSNTINSKEKPAAVAKGFAMTVVIFASAAPMAGPKVNATLKQAPTSAMVEPLCSSVLISVAIAVASWTFPSLNPPTIRLSKNVRKSTAKHHKATLAMLPHMLHRSAVLLPYLSDALPMTGLAIACRKEKRDPSAPPSKTISYFSLIGTANEDLYAFK